jgi:uncharacterized protein (DUF486 family)
VNHGTGGLKLFVLTGVHCEAQYKPANGETQDYTMNQPTFLTILLLMASNVFMTFAWYGHLKNLAASPWYIAALVSWGIALAEYLLQVPANRIGHLEAGFSVGRLKIMQEVITLSVFVPFAVLYLKEPIKLDYLWAALCMVGAAYFVFRTT